MNESRRIARAFLNGVGDSALGEWEEAGDRGVFHVRRRLSAAEQSEFGIPAVRDIRNKPEEYDRLRALFADAPYLRSVL